MPDSGKLPGKWLPLLWCCKWLLAQAIILSLRTQNSAECAYVGYHITWHMKWSRCVVTQAGLYWSTVEQVIFLDESWLHHLQPETKYASNGISIETQDFEWHHKLVRLCWLFCDINSIIVTDFMQKKSTVNSEIYCKLRFDVLTVVKMLSSGF